MLGKIKSYWNIFVSHFSAASNRKTLSLIAVVAVVVTLPVVVVVAQQTQIFRQRAAEPISPPFPISSPIPTPKPVQLRPGYRSITPNGSGEVTVEVISYNAPTQLANVSLKGKLNNLMPNRTYAVMLCWKSEFDCSTSSTPAIITDVSGNVIFSGVKFGIFNRDSNPITFIKVVENLPPGPVPSSSCGTTQYPCLDAYYYLPIPALTPIPNPITSSARVFVTSATYNGNLGGVSGADGICQGAANGAKLGGTWRAWLSDLSGTAVSRLTHLAVPYKLAKYPSSYESQATIADNWNDLVDGADLKNPIVTDEFGKFWTSYLVWSNTGINGGVDMSPQGARGCSDWTSASSSNDGSIGTIVSKSPTWTSEGYKSCNASFMHLYCFEQSISTPTSTGTPSPTPSPSAAAPTPTPTPSGKPLVCGNYGDVNGDGVISNADANLILRFIVKSSTPTNEQKVNADISKDGKIGTADSVLILRYLANMITTFPICSTSASAK